MIAMDAARCALVHLRLHASSFEVFHCPQKITVGLNMLSVFKIVKSIGSSDTLAMHLRERGASELGIVLQNPERNASTEFFLRLLDIDAESIQIADADFQSILTIPSAYWQRLMRDMSALSDCVEVRSSGAALQLSCVGDFARQVTKIGEKKTDGGCMTVSGVLDNEVNAKYSLKYLNLFSKSCALCSTIELYLKPDYPLVISVPVASLGTLRFCLAPKDEGDKI